MSKAKPNHFARQEDTSALMNLLQSLETRLELPIVPGEASEWLENLLQQWDQLPLVYNRVVQQSHHPQLDQIATTDPEMLTCVQQLKREDAEILKNTRQLLDQIYQARQRVEVYEQSVEKDEALHERQIARLMDHGLALIIRIRKQESAMRTWFVESFQRDRGVAD